MGIYIYLLGRTSKTMGAIPKFYFQTIDDNTNDNAHACNIFVHWANRFRSLRPKNSARSLINYSRKFPGLASFFSTAR